jgi:hypothetical protein
VYCFYFTSADEKLQWMNELDEALCLLQEQAVSRRLEAAKVAHLLDTHADASSAFAAPDKKGTLLRRDAKTGAWHERGDASRARVCRVKHACAVVVLHQASLFYARTSEAASAAHVIDLRTAVVRYVARPPRALPALLACVCV